MYFWSSIAWGGVILPVGFASGEIPQVWNTTELAELIKCWLTYTELYKTTSPLALLTDTTISQTPS